jgi:hypothetical protein
VRGAHAYKIISWTLLIITDVVGCSGLERGHWIYPDERGGHGSEVAEELAGADIRIDAELTEDLEWEAESLDADEFEAGEKELETFDSAREVCESLPDSFIFCCSSDDECVGKLLRIGEDQCNPAVCKDGICVLTEAEPGTPCEDGNECTGGDFCYRVSGKMTCVSGTPLNCDDHNQCTDDFCDPSEGCKHSPNPIYCVVYFLDMDQDGFGISGNSKCLCGPSGFYTALQGGDCDDSDARIHPGGSVCGIDGDCDGSPLDPGEVCDDGNSVRWDGCTDCLFLEFQVNTWTTDVQRYPSITSLSNGGFVVVWQSYGQDGSSWGVYGQRFDSNGKKVGSEFQVNTWTRDKWYPSITSLSNGGFVVVWQSYGQDGSSWGVYGQRFDSNGNKVGSEFQVNTWTRDDQWGPSITSLSNGGFVVVWDSYGQDGSSWGVYGQRFDSNGSRVGSEFQVNTWTRDKWYPSITSLSNGGFVVVWQGYGQDGSSYGVYGQRFDSNGNMVGSEFRVNTWTKGSQENPSVTSLSNGGFVVVWQSNGQDGSGYGVYGQRFDSNGNKVGSEFQVNTWTPGNQSGPSITPLSKGGFVVVWESDGQDGSGLGVFGRIFGPIDLPTP